MSGAPPLKSLLQEHWELAQTLRHLQIHFDAERCKGVGQCYEVCPVGCWAPDPARQKVVFHDGERCIACGACVLQCPEDAIVLE